MAVTFNGVNQALKRLTNVVNGNSDYSCVFWFRNNAVPSGGNYTIPFITKKSDYSEYYRLISNPDTVVTFQEVENGSGPGIGSTTELTSGTWFAISYTRDASSGFHQLRMQGGGRSGLFGTVLTTLDEIWLGGDGVRFGSHSFAFFREWDTVLTNDELNAELKSPSAVITSNLITDTPLTSDLLDISGNGNDWTAVGSAPTFEADPTQSVLSFIEFSIGATVRTSHIELPNPSTINGIDGFANGAPIFSITNDFGQLIASINYASPHAPGTSATFAGGIVTSEYNTICLVYFNQGATYQRPVTAFPFADDILGHDPNNWPRINWANRIWKMRCRTSTLDYLTTTQTNNPFVGTYLPDGEIEVIVDGVTLFSLTGLTIKRAKISWFLNVIRVLVYPTGDMDSLWLCNTNAFPVISGPQNTPSGSNLQEFLDFNASSAPGWADSRVALVGIIGVIYNATAGLDGTVAACTNGGDINTTTSLTGVAPTATPYGSITKTITLTPVPPIPPALGTIVVQKVTFPSTDTQSFDFTATGLTPGTFSLANGETQTFINVPAGSGYGIAETPVAGYDTTYVVSNGSPIDNISITDGETVYVTVTNTKRGKIVIGKVSDPFSGAHVFHFTGVGITPDTFDLASEDELIIDDLPAGDGYSIVEVPDDNYVPYYLISNGDANTNTNITVVPGGTTVIMILNNFETRLSGLYQVVPAKTNDTVFEAGAEQVQVKIPNPYFETGMLGDL